MDKPSVGSEVYTGVAAFGRVYATIGAIIGLIIAIIVIIAGVAKIRDKHSAKVKATITNVQSCTSTTDKSGNTAFKCVVDVSFSLGGKTYSVSGVGLTQSAQKPQKGAQVTLQADPKNPTDVIEELPPKFVGWALVGAGLLVGAISVAVSVAAWKYKGFAAAEGTFAGLSMLTGNR